MELQLPASPLSKLDGQPYGLRYLEWDVDDLIVEVISQGLDRLVVVGSEVQGVSDVVQRRVGREIGI